MLYSSIMLYFKQISTQVHISGPEEEINWLKWNQVIKTTEFNYITKTREEITSSVWNGSKTVSMALGLYLHDIVKKAGEPCEFIEDTEFTGSLRNQELDYTLPGIVARDYQAQALEAVMHNYCGIVDMAVNAGKTEILAMICNNFPGNVLILVPTAVLLKQTVDRLEQYFGEVGMCGSGKLDLAPRIVVGIAKSTLAKIKYKKFDMILVDECHMHKSATTVNFLARQTQARVFGFSGTPFRKTSDQKFLDSAKIRVLYGRTIAKIGTHELVSRGISCEGDCFFVESNPPAYYDLTEEDSLKAYRMFISENKNRNAQIENFTVQLIQQGKVVCVSFKHVEHLYLVMNKVYRKLNGEAEIAALHGTVNKRDRDEILQGVKTGKIKAIFVSGAFGVGVSIPELDVMINAAAGKSTFEVVQRFGRILRGREGKRFTYIDFVDMLPRHKNQSRIRYKTIWDEFGTKPKFLSSKEAERQFKNL